MSTSTVDVKDIGVVDVAIKAVDSKDPNGAFEAVLSAPTLDRDGEIIDPKAFEPLPERIGIDIDHLMSVRGTVGSGRPFYDGDLLKFEGTFASTPLGQEVRTLVAEGHVWKMSVAFMAPKREVRDGVTHITAGELLNAAIVAIPANRDADITAAKSALALKVGARNSGDDAERLQQIHDLAVENGAECDTKAAAPAARKSAGPAPGAEVKTVAGSHEQRAEKVRAAIRQANPESYYVQIIATFDDAIVYQLHGWDEDTSGTYRCTYSLDGDAVTLGAAESVELTEVVNPKGVTDPETKAAAAAAAASPAEVLALAHAELAQAHSLI